MSHGRLPSIKFKQKEEEFYPIMRCTLCPYKWKGLEKDKKGKTLRVMSCKDTCVYLELGGASE